MISFFFLLLFTQEYYLFICLFTLFFFSIFCIIYFFSFFWIDDYAVFLFWMGKVMTIWDEHNICSSRWAYVFTIRDEQNANVLLILDEQNANVLLVGVSKTYAHLGVITPLLAYFSEWRIMKCDHISHSSPNFAVQINRARLAVFQLRNPCVLFWDFNNWNIYSVIELFL